MDKKECHQCHKELEIDTVFCSRCGTKLIVDAEDSELDLADVYRAVLRLENQLKQHNINQQLTRPVQQGQAPMRVAQGQGNVVVRKKKKKSSFSITSIIITILIILIMISISFIGTVFVNMHASGYTKTSGEVVNELLDMFQGNKSIPVEGEAYEEVVE